MKPQDRAPNLLDMKPHRLVEWETADDGSVTVLVPKFRNPILVRWVLPRLAHPHVRVKLDAVGSVIWNQCDGAMTVSQIAGVLQQQFGASVEPVGERIGSFLRHLERGDLLRIDAA